MPEWLLLRKFSGLIRFGVAIFSPCEMLKPA